MDADALFSVAKPGEMEGLEMQTAALLIHLNRARSVGEAQMESRARQGC